MVFPKENKSRRLNRKDRMILILKRDGNACVWCRKPFYDHLILPTTEHLVPKIKGGPSWLENELAACKPCNRLRGHSTIGQWLYECEQKGWAPNRTTIINSLKALKAAIRQRGGQRRARSYIDAQLRRIDK